MSSTIEFFGTTTFRLCVRGLTIFHDAWLERPGAETLLSNHSAKADYVLIHHAHFDHLPGADIMAKVGGAKIIANSEAINVLRKQGIPEDKLQAVAGGERMQLAPGVVLRTYPALHCLMPFSHNDTPSCLQTDFEYQGRPEQSPLDITELLTERLTKLREAPPDVLPNEDLRTFQKYIQTNWDRFSLFDGGCIAYQLIVEGEGSVFFNAHPGIYSGIYRALDPKPDYAILGLAGQPCIDGHGYSGTTAAFIGDCLQDLDWPTKVSWALHDEQLLDPKLIETSAVEKVVKDRGQGRTTVVALRSGKSTPLFGTK